MAVGSEQRWEAMLAVLVAFRDQFGHADVPRSYRTAEGLNLGAWLHRQRVLAQKDVLEVGRRDRLSGVGVRWSFKADPSEGLEAFAWFVGEFGHGLVPHDFRTAGGFPLGVWVQSRRRHYASDPTKAERLWPTLTGLGFVWKVRDLEGDWLAGLAALSDYRAQHGDVLVPSWYVTPAGLALGRWLDSRRVEKRSNSMPAYRVDELSRLGVTWRLRAPAHDPARRAREDAHFHRMLRATRTWIYEHDRLPPARAAGSDGAAVGRWLVRQRQLDRAGRLDATRVAKLDDALPGWRS